MQVLSILTHAGRKRMIHLAGPGPTWFQMMLSVLAAFFGVQSNRIRERDFQHGKPGPFIILGVIFAILFVLALVMIVQWVIRSHAPM